MLHRHAVAQKAAFLRTVTRASLRTSGAGMVRLPSFGGGWGDPTGGGLPPAAAYQEHLATPHDPRERHSITDRHEDSVRAIQRGAVPVAALTPMEIRQYPRPPAGYPLRVPPQAAAMAVEVGSSGLSPSGHAAARQDAMQTLASAQRRDQALAAASSSRGY
jgi:hypothetical protein